MYKFVFLFLFLFEKSFINKKFFVSTFSQVL